MNALNINWLAHRRAPSLVSLALLALGLAALVTALQNYSDAQDEHDFQVSRQERADRRDKAERSQRAAKAPQLATSGRKGEDGAGGAGAAGAETLARMAAQLDAAWHPLLQSLEQQALPDVALLQLDVSASAHTVRLIGEAKTMDDALHYVNGLQKVAQLRNVALQSHEEKLVGASSVVRFTVSADWSVNHG